MNACSQYLIPCAWPSVIDPLLGAKSYQFLLIKEQSKDLDSKIQKLFGTQKEREYLDPEDSLLVRRFFPGVSNPVAASLARALNLQETDVRVDSILVFKDVAQRDQAALDLKYLWREPAIEELYACHWKEWIQENQDFPALPQRRDDSFDQGKPETWGLEFSKDELTVLNEEAQRRGRQWNRAEWELIAQTWSEHCKHKIFGAKILAEDALNSETQGLFKTHIRAPALKMQSKNPELLMSLFHDNAGVLTLYDKDQKKTDWAICMKMETHNSPSAIAPYGGASTGIVGVHRDILGTGRGALPICNWDVLCFESSDHEEERPETALPAEIIRKGVIKGIEDGGNQSGIPTVQGSVVFHPSYAVKPLVYAGALGLMPRDFVDKKADVGQVLFCVGGATGADGLRGAVMSSRDLRSDDFTGSVVQVANAFTQRRLTDFLMDARDQGLIDVVTDNGAGGLASSVGEMATLTGGAEIDLTKIRKKYEALLAWEHLLSESQERMTVGTSQPEKFKALADKWEVSYDEMGTLNDSGSFRVLFEGKSLVDIDLNFLHEQCPQLQLKSSWNTKNECELLNKKRSGLVEKKVEWSDLFKMLSSEHLCSREGIVRRFDHEVQGRTLRQAFAGKSQESPQDGTSLYIREAEAFFALGHGLAPWRGCIEENTLIAFDEAIKHCLMAGGRLKEMGLLDNFSWSDPTNSERHLWRLLRSCEVLGSLCTQLELPLVSGKDSMKNNNVDFRAPETLVISAGASACAPENLPAGFFTRANDLVYWIPPLAATLRDSVWERALKVKASEESEFFRGLSAKERNEELLKWSPVLKSRYERFEELLGQGSIRSAKDVGEGGVITALFEMSLGRSLSVHLEGSCENPTEFFQEGLASWVLSVDPHEIKNLEECFPEAQRIGVVINREEILSSAGSLFSLKELRSAYLREGLEDLWQ